MFFNTRNLGKDVRVVTLLLAFTQPFFSQSQPAKAIPYNLSIKDAITYSKNNNKWIQIAKKEQTVVEHEKKDAINGILPQMNVGGGYQRFSNLTLYTDGLGGAESGPRRPSPNGANLGFDASFNIYSGGRNKALIEEASIRKDLATLNTEELSGNIGLQTVAQYLDLVRLNDLKRYISDQLERAEARLMNINSLFENQKVTRSDVLRAEVMLSNVRLNLQQVQNDLSITNQKLNVLLDLPEDQVVIPTDSAGIPKPALPALETTLQSLESTAYPIQRSKLNIQAQEARLKGVKSNNLPSLYFTTAYNFTYPNYLFYPPVDQLYSIGFVGLKVQYNISSLYHNKHKTSYTTIRIDELKVQREAIEDNAKQEIKSYYIKYGEALNRISVNEKSVEQARVNYKIVSTKYFNQLALLTDLLDADNLYQESRFNLVKAQTEALFIYYKLQFSIGNL